MQKIILLFSLLLAAYCTQAQSFNIAGSLKDINGKGITGITISLLKASDSSWVRSEYTDDSGIFNFKAIATGDYIVDVFATGYKNNKQKITLTTNIYQLNITLQKGSTQLKEVTVTDKRPFIEQDLGKTIVNVSSSITTAGSNVLDLLRRSPGITVDMNGNITMQGKQGVLVLIDNKETYLSGQQLADYLRTLSAEQVAQLELITQPSARYDAEGNAGIINIKTKKNRTQGLNGTVMASYKQGVYPGTINSVRIEQTKNKLHLEASYTFLHMTGFEQQNGWHNIENEQNGLTQYHFDEDGFLTETFEDHNLHFGAAYKLSDKTTINGNITGIYHTNAERDYLNDHIIDSVNNSSYNNAFTRRGFLRRNILVNAEYRHDFNKDNNIAVLADYLIRDENDFDNTVNTNYDASMQPIPGGYIFKDLHPNLINASTIRVDYTAQLKNKVKIEAGAKSSYATISDRLNDSVLQNNIYIPDTMRSNHFSYHENINALYISANKRFGKKWETQAGLRCENDITSGIQETGTQSFSNNTTSLFPTLFIAYTLNKNNRFEFNYGRRVSRPSYTWLNPYVRYLSQYYYEVGNPTLQPEYSNNIELKHTYHNHLTTTCSYSHSNGMAGDVIHILGNTEYKSIENIAVINELGIGITYNAPIFKWWSLSVSGSYYNVAFMGVLDGRNFNISRTRCYFHTNNQFSFKNNWAAEAGYFCAGNNIEGFMTDEEPRQWLSLGFSKKLFNDTTTLKLNIEDPFNAYVYTYLNNWYNLDSRTQNRWDNRQLSLSVTYNFGKNTHQRSNHDAPEEQERMGM